MSSLAILIQHCAGGYSRELDRRKNKRHPDWQEYLKFTNKTNYPIKIWARNISWKKTKKKLLVKRKSNHELDTTVHLLGWL